MLGQGDREDMREALRGGLGLAVFVDDGVGEDPLRMQDAAAELPAAVDTVTAVFTLRAAGGLEGAGGDGEVGAIEDLLDGLVGEVGGEQADAGAADEEAPAGRAIGGAECFEDLGLGDGIQLGAAHGAGGGDAKETGVAQELNGLGIQGAPLFGGVGEAFDLAAEVFGAGDPVGGVLGRDGDPPLAPLRHAGAYCFEGEPHKRTVARPTSVRARQRSVGSRKEDRLLDRAAFGGSS